MSRKYMYIDKQNDCSGVIICDYVTYEDRIILFYENSRIVAMMPWTTNVTEQRY